MAITFQPTTEACLLAVARARGKTPDEVVASLLDALPANLGEDNLLQEIAQGLPETFWRRYRALIAKREAATLTTDEQQELIDLSDQAEERTLRRTQALMELAARRNVPFDLLRQQMGIEPTSVSA